VIFGSHDLGFPKKATSRKILFTTGGSLRHSDARRIERQSKTRTQFSAATAGVDHLRHDLRGSIRVNRVFMIRIIRGYRHKISMN